MCCVCGQGHMDMRTVEGTQLQVCLSERYCLIEALRTAPVAEIHALHARAVSRAIRVSEIVPQQPKKVLTVTN